MEKLDTPILNAPEQLLPFTKDQADALEAHGQLGNDLTHKHPCVSQMYLKTMIPRCLLPALARLDFLGLEDADIRIVADWIPEDAYEGRPGMPIGMHEYTVDVSIAGFFVLFYILCATFESSTTAHRRFKRDFTGQRFYILFDANGNQAHLYMTPALADALNAGFSCWTQAR